ncbi:MAG TPA: hypothetical protein VIO32_06595, partial [Candidatus Baltobacteraceae bacterium]
MIDLRVPPQADYAPLAAHLAADAAVRAQLAAEQSQQLAQAVKLAFELIVRDAMAAEREPIHVHAAWNAEDLRVAISERGLPLDDAAARRDPNWATILDCVERAQWKLHAHGSELVLTVRRPHGIGGSGEEP